MMVTGCDWAISRVPIWEKLQKPRKNIAYGVTARGENVGFGGAAL